MFGPSALYPTIKSSMRDKSGFNSANLVAHVLSLAVYLLVGLLAYAAFGIAVEENVIYSMGELEPRNINGVRDMPKYDRKRLERSWIGWPVSISMVCCCVVASPVRFMAFFGSIVKNFPSLRKSAVLNTVFRVATVFLVLGTLNCYLI